MCQVDQITRARAAASVWENVAAIRAGFGHDVFQPWSRHFIRMCRQILCWRVRSELHSSLFGVSPLGALHGLAIKYAFRQLGE